MINFQKFSKGSGISYLDYMIAHYKCNEGQGNKVFNHAGLALAGGGRLPDLDIVDINDPLNFSNFWLKESGFGYSIRTFDDEEPAICYAFKVLSNIKDIKNDRSHGIFIKRCEIWYGGSGFGLILGDIDSYLRDIIGIASSENYHAAILQDIVETTLSLNEWVFLFCLDVSQSSYMITQDGILHKGIAIPSYFVENLLRIILGACYLEGLDYYEGLGGAIGDSFFINKKTASLKDFSILYDSYKSRYGMAPRSGW